MEKKHRFYLRTKNRCFSPRNEEIGWENFCEGDCRSGKLLLRSLVTFEKFYQGFLEWVARLRRKAPCCVLLFFFGRQGSHLLFGAVFFFFKGFFLIKFFFFFSRVFLRFSRVF